MLRSNPNLFLPCFDGRGLHGMAALVSLFKVSAITTGMSKEKKCFKVWTRSDLVCERTDSFHRAGRKGMYFIDRSLAPCFNNTS